MIDNQNPAPQQMVTFTTGEYTFGVNVLDVQEVLKRQQMTKVPLASGEVRGLINLRGHIVTAIGMRERLRMKGRQDGIEEMNLILALHDGAASLVVDGVGDVIAVDPSKYKPRPRGLKDPLKEMVLGVYESEAGLCLHIAPEIVCKVGSQDGKD